MSRRSVVFVLVALASGASAQDRAAVLSGVVTDAETGETLVGATVVAGGRGGATNAYGFFSLELAPGPVRVVVGYVGYAAHAVDVDLAGDLRLDVALARGGALGEVVVEADDGAPPRPEATAQMGRIAVQGDDVRRVPALLGEADVLKAVQLLPGVRAGQEGTAGLYVRGGSPDQTLVLLDGAPIYNAAHLFGFLSTFNGDAVSRVELTKGAYPARHGGRLGSVLDVRLRDGDAQRHRVGARVGVLAAQVTAEGPVVPGRASFLVSARRTYLDVLTRPFIDRANRRAEAAGEARVDPRVSFFDVHAKLNGRLSARDRVYVSLYAGGDAFAFESVDPVEACRDGACRASGVEDVYGGALDWGNVLGSLRYTRVLSPRAFAALTVTASDYAFDVGVDVEEGRGGPAAQVARARYRSGIRDLGARLDVDVLAGRGHALRVGAAVTRHRFTPGALALAGGAATGDVDSLLTESRSVGIDAAVYAEDTWDLGGVELGLGLRGAVYASGRFVYPSVEPRVSALVPLGGRVALKASAAVTQQPVHLLTTGAGVGLPADLWVPADSVGPERGGQVAVGLAGSSASGRTTWSVEGYARWMRGLVAYRDGASFATPSADWQDLVVTGAGRSRGVEAFARHDGGRVTAWASYTLAWADRQFDALGGGARFPFRYDRRHDLSAVALARVSRRLDVSAALAWGSGDAVTLPGALHDGTYLGDGNVESWVRTSEAAIEETTFGPRNGHRLPAVARLDLGATFFLRRGPRPHAVALHVYNATNRKAPFVTRFESRPDPATGGTRKQLVGIALFPVLPTLSYQVSL